MISTFLSLYFVALSVFISIKQKTHLLYSKQENILHERYFFLMISLLTRPCKSLPLVFTWFMFPSRSLCDGLEKARTSWKKLQWISLDKIRTRWGWFSTLLLKLKKGYKNITRADKLGNLVYSYICACTSCIALSLRPFSLCVEAVYTKIVTDYSQCRQNIKASSETTNH